MGVYTEDHICNLIDSIPADVNLGLSVGIGQVTHWDEGM